MGEGLWRLVGFLVGFFGREVGGGVEGVIFFEYIELVVFGRLGIV